MKYNQLYDRLTAYVQINGHFPTIREFQEECGYKSPRSIHVLFERLEKEGKIFRVTRNKFAINQTETQTIFKKYIDSLDIKQLQNYKEYIDLKINLMLCEQNLVSSVENHTQTLGANAVHPDVSVNTEQI